MHDISIDPDRLLKTEKWLTNDEIQAILTNVSHIILAQPNFHEKAPTKAHFTIFLNTQENLPAEVIEPILEKFCEENDLIDITNFHHLLGDVAFAKTNLDQPMPYFLAPESQESLEEGGTIKNYIFDFDANASSGFKEISEGQSGWSFVYNDKY